MVSFIQRQQEQLHRAYHERAKGTPGAARVVKELKAKLQQPNPRSAAAPVKKTPAKKAAPRGRKK